MMELKVDKSKGGGGGRVMRGLYQGEGRAGPNTDRNEVFSRMGVQGTRKVWQ